MHTDFQGKVPIFWIKSKIKPISQGCKTAYPTHTFFFSAAASEGTAVKKTIDNPLNMESDEDQFLMCADN